jgi:hypothetical protein
MGAVCDRRLDLSFLNALFMWGMCVSATREPLTLFPFYLDLMPYASQEHRVSQSICSVLRRGERMEGSGEGWF